jgi:Papain family cysteine protease
VPRPKRRKQYADQSRPKTTRADTSERRDPPIATRMARAAAAIHGESKTSSGIPVDTTEREALKKSGTKPRKLDAMPDRIDVRDWPYQPTLRALPPELISIGDVPAILDQGKEGACTGYGLAAVINYQLARRDIKRQVSPRMLYEMARKYDEWPGERYEGSSARGAMIGWVRHGVAPQTIWTPKMKGSGHLTPQIAQEAQNTPGGAYYRVTHTQVRDVHAALFELGAIYMTIMVHDGWDKPGPSTVPITYIQKGKKITAKLPVITRFQHAPDGHAVAIVGYTKDGFIIQNSWGSSWGYEGFALLPYEDFMIHATDVWAAQVGVPVSCDVWVDIGRQEGTTAGLQRAAESIPLDTIRPFVVDCGNNGLLSDSGQYWTTEADVERLFTQIIPEQTKTWKKKRVALYLHGGLNSESDVAKRVVAFRDVFLQNEIYPVHIMWESSAMESLQDLISNAITGDDPRSGDAADWLKKVRDRLVEAKDRTFELTTARAGGDLWGDMKRNAMLSSNHNPEIGAMQLITKHVIAALNGVTAAEKAKWEFHVVAHSAGSIYFAYALNHLLELKSQGIAFSSVNFMAPAITTQLFKDLVYKSIEDKTCPLPSLFIMSDAGERDDTVGPYGKSLLYLVSNAFEGERGVPLLGMQFFLTKDQELTELFNQEIPSGHPALVLAGKHPNIPDDQMTPDQKFSISESESHGGFDNDPATLNSILRRILVTSGATITREFTSWELKY